MPDYTKPEFYGDRPTGLVGEELDQQHEDYVLAGLKPEDMIEGPDRAAYEKYLKDRGK